jgi:alpha-beta hydrolase superfamily lysophospholipase
VLATLAVTVAACGAGAAPGGPVAARATLPTVDAPSPASTRVPAFYRAPDPLPAGRPGTLLRAERVVGVPGVPSSARVWRILYRSRDVAGRGVAVSGYVIAPAGTAPRGGYPVVAWDHGTTGMAAPCAPSLFTNLDGQQEYLAPYLGRYLARGYAVVASDYQGLGTGPLHPYLVGDVEAWDTLDAVRAAGHLAGLDLSADVVVVGHSQGGQASLFTGQLAATYAPELHLLGVVAIAPATDLKAAVEVSSLLTSSGGIAHGQGDLDFIAMALWAWTHTYPDLPVSSVFTAEGRRAMAVAGAGCLPQIAVALRGRTEQQLLVAGATSDPAVLAAASRNDAGATRTPVPVLVVQGTGDQTVPWQLTRYFVDHVACPVGDRVTLTLYPGDTHSGVIAPAAGEVLGWVAARFAGTPAPDGCGKTVPTPTTGAG